MVHICCELMQMELCVLPAQLLQCQRHSKKMMAACHSAAGRLITLLLTFLGRCKLITTVTLSSDGNLTVHLMRIHPEEKRVDFDWRLKMTILGVGRFSRRNQCFVKHITKRQRWRFWSGILALRSFISLKRIIWKHVEEHVTQTTAERFTCSLDPLIKSLPAA